MNIQDYIRVLRRRGWIIVLAIAVTAVSAGVFSLVMKPEYRSSVQVAITLARPDFGLTQSIKQLLRSYATQMWSKEQASQVVRELGLMETPEDLIGNVKIVSDESIMVLQIDVDRYDGEEAYQIARKWADLLVQFRDADNSRQDKENRVYASVIEPVMTYYQIRPKTTINIAAGAVFGLVLGGVVVFVLEWLEAGIVRDPRQFEAETSLTIIGVIPPE